MALFISFLFFHSTSRLLTRRLHLLISLPKSLSMSFHCSLDEDEPLKIPPSAGWCDSFLHAGCLIYLLLPLYPPNSPPGCVFPLLMLLSTFFCLNSYPFSPNLAFVLKTIFFSTYNVPIPVFLPKELHGQKSLVDHHP